MSEISRLLALLVLGFPAILVWQALRRADPGAAWRYVGGIAGMMLWSTAGVLVIALVLPVGGSALATAAAIAFLLSWVGIAIAGFLAFGVPADFVRGVARQRLETVALGLAAIAILSGLVSLAAG